MWRIEMRLNDMAHGRNPFLSAPFAGCIFRRVNPDAPLGAVEHGHVRLTVEAPEVMPHERVCMVGADATLGGWNTDCALPLNDADFPRWSIDLPANAPQSEYKFIIRDTRTGNVVWEEGHNRWFGGRGDSHMAFRCPEHRWRGSGVAVPVFSLRSEADFGVGDFADLHLLADWAKATGQSFIQILPVNDTTMSRTNDDSYPYNANSTFALNPMYLRPELVGVPVRKADRDRFGALRKKLQATATVDYTTVTAAKEAYTRLIYREQGKATVTSREFAGFVTRNASWLLPYAAWCTLRDRYATADITRWGDDAVYSPERVAQLLLTDPHEMQYVMFVQYHLDCQLREAHAYANSLGVALKGDIPIGISRCSADAWQHPGLFNLGMQAGAPPDDFAVRGQNWGFPTYNWERMAADGYAWWRQRLQKMAEFFDAYRIDHVLGFFRIWQIPVGASHGLLGHFYPAMPLSAEDMAHGFGFRFSDRMLMPGADTGGYATQRAAEEAGDEVAADAFDDVLFVADSEMRLRFHPRIAAQKTSHYRSLSEEQRRAFDRLYEDYFYHRHNEFWRGKAMEKLPALAGATTMLPCAEDLGMIPASVPSVLADLQILSLEVQRMPKEYGREFGHPAGYPYMSVCTTSTHDMAGLRGWLADDPERAARFVEQEYGADALAGLSAGDPDAGLCRRVIDTHLTSPSMLAIIPLQDYLATDASVRRADYAAEQINDPANPHHYWCYRMHLPLEQLPVADFSRG